MDTDTNGGPAVTGKDCIFFVTLTHQYIKKYAEIYKKSKKNSKYIKKLVTDLRHPYAEQFLPAENMLALCYRYHEKAYLGGLIYHCSLKSTYSFSATELCKGCVSGMPYPEKSYTKIKSYEQQTDDEMQNTDY